MKNPLFLFLVGVCTILLAEYPTAATDEMSKLIEQLRKREAESNSTTPQVTTRIVPELRGWVLHENGKSSMAIAIGDKLSLFTPNRTVQTAFGPWKLGPIENGKVSLTGPLGGEHVYSIPFQQVETDASKESLRLVMADRLNLETFSRMFTDVTGTRLAISKNAREQEISLYLPDVKGRAALDALALTHELYLSEPGDDSNILRIHTIDEYALSAETLDEEHTNVFVLSYPNAREIAIAIQDLYGDRVKLAERISDSDDPDDYTQDELENRLSRFEVIDARSQGLGFNSPGTGNSFRGSRSNNTSSRLRNTNRFDDDFSNRNSTLRDNVRQVDVITRQEGLSAEDIALLEQGDARTSALVLQTRSDIHITVIDRIHRLIVRTRDNKTMKQISDLVEELDKPTPLVFLELEILEVALTDGLDSAFNWTFTDRKLQGSFLPGGANTGGNLGFTYLTNSFQTQIEILAREGRITTLSQPVLLTANHEVSRLFIGEEVPLNRNFEGSQTFLNGDNDLITPASTDIEFRPVGSTILVTPSIREDKTVSLRILQEESDVVRNGAEVLVPDADGGFVTRNIDVISSQTTSGTFVAKDNETLVVGGLIKEEVVDQQSKVPILGDIPFLGRIFRNETTRKERSELILLITPRIVPHPGVGQKITNPFMEKESLHPRATDPETDLETYEKKDVLKAPGLMLR